MLRGEIVGFRLVKNGLYFRIVPPQNPQRIENVRAKSVDLNECINYLSDPNSCNNLECINELTV